MAEDIADEILSRNVKRVHRPSEMDLNLTPMIDVLFMLMLFLLLGTRFGAREGILESKLPALSSGGPQPISKPVVISVNEDPSSHKPTVSVRFDEVTEELVDTPFREMDKGKPVDECQFDDTKLYQRLKYQQQQSSTPAMNVTVRIFPGSNVRWNYALQVYNTLYRAGYREIRWPQGAAKH